jgi:hypothetical protein
VENFHFYGLGFMTFLLWLLGCVSYLERPSAEAFLIISWRRDEMSVTGLSAYITDEPSALKESTSCPAAPSPRPGFSCTQMLCTPPQV